MPSGNCLGQVGDLSRRLTESRALAGRISSPKMDEQQAQTRADESDAGKAA